MKKVTIDKNQANFVAKLLFLSLVLACVRAIAAYVFINPNGFAPGGIAGISAIIHYAAERSSNPTIVKLASSLFDPGIMTLLLNIPLVIAAFCVLDRKFATYTTITLTFYSGFVFMFGAVGFPQFYADGNYGLMLIAALAGGAIGGTGLGFMLRQDLSVGGTDIIGKIIYKHNSSAHVHWWIMICDCVVAIMSGSLGLIGLEKGADATVILTKILSPILYSFISLFTSSKVCDTVESGMMSSLVFTIITDKSDAIAHELSIKLHRGVTITKSVGYYTGKEHNVIICVTSKKQINRVKDIVTACDPNAFMYITQAGEVSGKGFTGGKLVKNGAVEPIDMSDVIPSEHIHDNPLDASPSAEVLQSSVDDLGVLQAVDNVNVLQSVQTVDPTENAACDVTDNTDSTDSTDSKN